jgi:three-Cys-motif partner protein
MAAKDLFREPFDEGTKFKLRIFEDYFKEWLPVFISSPRKIWNEIQIFDLFSGEGKDVKGVLGSPLIILNTLNLHVLSIQEKKIKVRVVLNELDRDKYETLVSNIENVIIQNFYDVKKHNDDFKKLFELYYDSMKESANFLFLDQNGIKQITEEVFKRIIELKQTDFLFFISSSFIKRFGDSESFQKYLRITSQDLAEKSYYHIHRIVLEYYRSLIPDGKKYYLAPFSIKKPAGVYGLIFGSNHIYGLEKFLSVCWKHDKLTGEANFDIDNERIDIRNPSLFMEFNVPKKIQLFEERLKSKILAGDLSTDLAVYLYSLEEGFLPKHANNVLDNLKVNGKIDFAFKVITSKVHKITQPSKINIK